MSAAPPGHQARKRFGQNFLHDANIIDNIIRSINPKPGDHIVEIGPGLGAITEHLLDATEGHLDVVELDRDLIPILRTKFFNHSNFEIHEGDALKFDYETLVKGDYKLRMVGNLPYNISTPLIFKILEHERSIQDMHFMLQKEVVERMAAAPGEKAYGKLGIMLQYYCRVQPLFIVPPGAFKPRPKVDSAIVRLIPHTEKPIEVKDAVKLNQVVSSAFNMRRKTIRNSLGGMISANQLEDLGIDPGLRAEKLSLAEFAVISDALI